MTAIRLLPLIFLVAACGVDGRPIPPSQVPDEEREVRTGILVTGSAEIGVAGRL
jgi:hypothetical protein